MFGQLRLPLQSEKFLVSNDFSKKLVGIFVTLGGNKPDKTLDNMKKTVNAKQMIGEVAITQVLKNKDETEEQVINWCSNIQQQLKK